MCFSARRPDPSESFWIEPDDGSGDPDRWTVGMCGANAGDVLDALGLAAELVDETPIAAFQPRQHRAARTPRRKRRLRQGPPLARRSGAAPS